MIKQASIAGNEIKPRLSVHCPVIKMVKAKCGIRHME